MADAIGKDGLHKITGTCALCGDECDPSTEELNVLTCTFARCDDNLCHQDCLEKFLKRINCEKNRKTGFQCPRGHGRKPGEPCPGRIDKSHPIHPRKEIKPKKVVKQVQPDASKRFGPEVKAQRKREKEERERQKLEQARQEKQDQENRKALTKKQVSDKQTIDNNKRKAVAEELRRQLKNPNAGRVESTPVAAAAPAQPMTLDDYERKTNGSNSLLTPSGPGRGAHPVTSAVSNAWGAKATGVEGERPSLTSSAFPAILGARSSSAVPARDVRPVLQRKWSESVTNGPDEQPPMDPTANYASFALRQPPPPPPPPPMQAQGGQPSASVRVAATTSSPSLPPYSSVSESHKSDSSQTSTAGQPATLDALGALPSASLPVGAVYADDVIDEGKLTKSQKKNMKRAERKARTAGGAGSPAALDWTAVSQPLLEQSMTHLAQFKTTRCLQQLQQVGFEHWFCVAAIQRVGADVERATDWMCDQPDQDWFDDVTTFQGPSVHVDLSQEMEWIIEAALALPCAVRDVHSAVVECKGDVYNALLQLQHYCCSDGAVAQWTEGHIGTESALAVLSDV